jgi:hypothetical protein
MERSKLLAAGYVNLRRPNQRNMRNFGFEFYPPVAWVPLSQEHENVLPTEMLVQFVLTLRSLENALPLSGWLGKVLPYARGLPYQTIYVDFYNLEERAINFTALGRWDPQ